MVLSLQQPAVQQLCALGRPTASTPSTPACAHKSINTLRIGCAPRVARVLLKGVQVRVDSTRVALFWGLHAGLVQWYGNRATSPKCRWLLPRSTCSRANPKHYFLRAVVVSPSSMLSPDLDSPYCPLLAIRWHRLPSPRFTITAFHVYLI